MPTIAQQLTQLESDRSDLVDNLETKGITGLSGDETFTELVPEVLNISGGGSSSEYFSSLSNGTAESSSGITKSIKKLPSDITITATSGNYLFSGASNLEEVPLINTSSWTYATYMFSNCSSLTTIPAYDFSNVQYGSSMFYKCSSLQTIPVLNMPKLKTCPDMFYQCSSLTDTGLNNILATLLTFTSSYSSNNKKLSNIGLTSSQATRCTNLSNWDACVSAGWTTGY